MRHGRKSCRKAIHAAIAAIHAPQVGKSFLQILFDELACGHELVFDHDLAGAMNCGCRPYISLGGWLGRSWLTTGRKAPKRRRWRIKRGGFEEVPRLAGVNSARESAGAMVGQVGKTEGFD